MISLTDEKWQQIKQVNKKVNAGIRYTSEAVDSWNVILELNGDSPGDCDDYASTKRQLLIDLGFDWRDLRLATCWTKHDRDEWKNYHLVLVVDTNKGKLVLDNAWDDIDHMEDRKYLFHKIQDFTSVTGWRECDIV